MFDISNKTARQALKGLWLDEKMKKETIASLQKIDDGTLLPRNTKNFKGLKEHKFSKIRILFEPGKNGQPKKIVAIFNRRDMDLIEKALRDSYKTK